MVSMGTVVWTESHFISVVLKSVISRDIRCS